MLTYLEVLFWVFMAFIVIHFAAWRMAWREEPRSRVDWQRVYRMELGVWGCTFEHIGAPPYREHNPFDRLSGWTFHNIETNVARHRLAEATSNEPLYNMFGTLIPLNKVNEARERMGIVRANHQISSPEEIKRAVEYVARKWGNVDGD